MLTSLRALRAASMVVPVIACAAWGQYTWTFHRQQAVERATKNVRIVEEYVLRVVLTQDAVLAQADEATRNLTWDQIAVSAYVHERLQQIGARSDGLSSIGLIDPTGRIRNSGCMFPVDTDVSDRAYFRRMRDGTEALYVGDRISSRLSGTDVIAVVRRRGGETFDGLVGMSLRTQALSEFFAKLVDDPDSATGLYDGEANLLARQPFMPPTQLPPTAPLVRAMLGGSQGVFEAEAVTDGMRRLYAFTRVGDLPLFVSYGIAKSAVVDRWLTGMYAAGLLALLTMLAVWLLTGRAMRKAQLDLAYRDQLATEVASKTAHLHEALAERDTLLRSKDQLLEQKETLLREVHHRVKNNLQMMASMVRVVSRAGVAEARPAFDEIARRITTVGRAYEHVHRQDDLSKLDLGDYLRGICEQVVESSGRDDIRLEVDLDAIRVDVDTALPVGLIAGELITNAYKHAFPPGRGGSVAVSLKAVGADAMLIVADTGVGIDPERLSRSAGLRIAEALAGQVDGQIGSESGPEGGTRFRMTFKLRRGA